MLTMTTSLGDAADVFASIPGISTAVDYIKGQAKAGAEQAIPDIQSQVKSVVLPYILIALVLGVGGLAFGLKAYYKSKKPKQALAGRRYRR